MRVYDCFVIYVFVLQLNSANLLCTQISPAHFFNLRQRRFHTISHAALGLDVVARTPQRAGDPDKDAILPGPPGIRTAVSGRMCVCDGDKMSRDKNAK